MKEKRNLSDMFKGDNEFQRKDVKIAYYIFKINS